MPVTEPRSRLRTRHRSRWPAAAGALPRASSPSRPTRRGHTHCRSSCRRALAWDARFNLSASAGGTATLAFGISGSTGKYRAAATLTTTDSWVSVGLNAAMGVELAAAEQIIMTVGAAALPSSGRMVVLFVYSID